MEYIADKNIKSNIGFNLFMKNVLDIAKVKLRKKEARLKELDRLELIETIRNTVREREYVNTLFEMASEKDLVDYCSYSLMAIEAKYNYYLKIAKENNIKVEKYLALPAVAEK